MRCRLASGVFSRAAIACIAVLFVTPTSRRLQAAEDVLEQSRVMYAGLRSYADNGAVLYEYGTSGKDRHTFATLFNRAPRQFQLDFNKQGGDRYVVWGDPDAFHTWWKATAQRFDFPNPNNLPALDGSSFNTLGVSNKIPTLLYAKAQLSSDFGNFRDAAVNGSEEVDGRRCYRLAGWARDVYGGTGNEVNVRKMTVWIDADSRFIRKILEQWQPLPGQVSQKTTTFAPQANPTIDEGRFRFMPPAPR